MPGSLRTRLVLTYFVTIFVASWLTGTLVLGQMRSALIDEKERAMLLSANVAANAAADLIADDLSYLVRDLTAQLDGRVLILDPGGTVIADAYGELTGVRLTQRVVGEARVGDSGTSIGVVGGRQVMYAAVPVIRDRDIAGIVFLSADLEPVLAGVEPVRRLLLLGSLLGGLAAGVLGYVFAAGLTGPLRQLAGVARDLARGRLEREVRVPRSRDEVAQLARAFAAMVDHLQREDRLRRMFVENASHELRSPLASMRVLAQSLLDDPDCDPRLYREFLQDIDREIDRLDGLARGLLDLTRSQALSLGFSREPVDVARVARAVTERLAGFARERGARVEIRGSAVWMLEREWFAIALQNLVHNGLKYVGEGEGRVEVLIDGAGDRLEVRVRDNGEGIPAGDLPHVFERFYRVDRARARATGGTGLGLSIVRQVVDAHGGEVAVDSVVGRGSEFVMVFPKAGGDQAVSEEE